MCVIAVNEDARMTEDHVEKMWTTNPAGGGIAWRDGEYVRWKKGLELEEMKDLTQTLPLPFVAHFRIPSGGFGAFKALTHPFPVTKQAGLQLEGKTKGWVLFHNGHWKDWKETSLKTALQSKDKLPPGKWSDTRSMAYVVAHYGMGILEFIDEKVIIFTPSIIEAFQPTGWSKVDGLWVSNKSWEYKTVAHNVVNQMNQTHNAYNKQPDRTTMNAGNYHTTVPASITPSVGPAISNQVVANGRSGGPSVQETFRPSTPSIPAGQTVAPQAEGGKEETNQGQVSRKPLICLPPGVTELGLDMMKWARGLNPRTTIQ